MRKLVQVWWAVAIIVAVAISVTIPVTIISVTIAIAVMVAIPAAAVIVVPVAGPFTPFAVAAVDDFEVGEAAAIDPDAVADVSPGAIEDAIGFAALANHADAEAGIGWTPGSAHVVRRAVDHVGFAPAAEFIVAPAGIAVPATIAIPVVISIVISVVIVSVLDYNGSLNADLELGAATVVDPDAVSVKAPREVLSAFGLAFLVHHLHSASGVHSADAAVHVIGVTGHP